MAQLNDNLQPADVPSPKNSLAAFIARQAKSERHQIASMFTLLMDRSRPIEDADRDRLAR